MSPAETAQAAIEDRAALIAALEEAAAVEHDLCCMYLYAAFSLRQPSDPGLQPHQQELVRGWKAGLLLIARQEMEHLGIVSNLLTAVGAAPSFGRPAFPRPARDVALRVPLELLPFGAEALRRFICLELPDGVTEPGCHPRPLTTPDGVRYSTVQRLYEEIEAGLRRLDASLGAALFVGPPSAQVGNADFSFSKGGAYDVRFPKVRDLKQALAALQQVIAEGEGSRENRAGSHYGRLVAMREELAAELARSPGFRPAHPVVANPAVGTAPGATPLRNPEAVELARLFNDAYQVMLLMMMRYYAHTDETRKELEALQLSAFFPLMTMVIRPLGEVLAEVPAGEDGGPERAGAPFQCPASTPFLPHKRAAWVVLHERLQGLADACAQAAARGGPHAERLAFLRDNVGRIAANFHGTLQAMEAP